MIKERTVIDYYCNLCERQINKDNPGSSLYIDNNYKVIRNNLDSGIFHLCLGCLYGIEELKL